MPETVTFDHYQVLTRDDGSLYELGRGAMGITYKAFDTNLRVPVALKVINTATLNSEIARSRFVREARSAAKLRHRHVASVFHLSAEGETYFYAMEFIDGETVEALIKRQGPLNPVLALRITLQVARALNAAQQHGLVHRDIKPSNLMLVREDDELVVKVIDFGLAKTCVPGEGDEDAATLSIGGFVGTPHFASPEQLEDREIDVRSDIYSLGVTLWYMLAGHTPFGGSMAQVMSQHLTKQPPFERLSGTNEPISRLLRRMLAKDREERQQTASQLRQEIEECLAQTAGGPSAAAAVGAIEEENFATLLDDSAMRSSSTSWDKGALVADRYEIQESLGESNTGRSFRAFDHQRGRAVRLHVLRRDFTEDKALYTQLEREVERLTPVEHPSLLRVFGLETVGDSSFLVLEATDGFSLMELLRARRELSLPELLPILDHAAAGVDYALSTGLRRLDLVLHQVHIHFLASGDTKPFLREPVTSWPSFQLKISPLGITRELAASETWAGGQTIVGGLPAEARGSATDSRNAYVKDLGTLVYELLGGTLLPLGGAGALASRYSPLASLTEAGNDVVRQSLQANGAYPSAAAFNDALRTAEEGEARRRDPSFGSRASATTFPTTPGEYRPPLPPSSKKIPFGFVGGVLSMAALGTVLYLFLRTADDKAGRNSVRPPQPTPTATPTPTPVPKAPDNPAGADNPPPPPEPPPEPTRQDLLKAAVSGAEALEGGSDWQRAIAAWLRVAKQFPEFDIGRVRLEMLIQRLSDRPGGLNDAEVSQLRDSLTEAAQLDVLAAMMLLGESLRDREPKTSFNWYSAAAERGSSSAMTQLGLMLSNGAGTEPDLAKAVTCFQMAADRNDPAAKAALAECFLYGKGVAKDEAKAIEYLKEASDQKNVRAMNRLGTCFHQGIGVKQNFAEAFRLFSDAAEQGYGEAIGNLGVLYINGEGVPPNALKAVELFQKGAKLDDAYCMYLLARCFEGGTGVGANFLQAKTWYKKAAEAGNARAADWCRKNKVPFAGRQP